MSNRALSNLGRGLRMRNRVSSQTKLKSALRFAAALLPALLLSGTAFAGPPFRTDDPEPVDYEHWEFYTFSTGSHLGGDTNGFAPGFEFNYGIIPNGQIHMIAPLAFDAPTGGNTQFGYGDTELGFKYRFVEEEKDGARPQIGVFPLVELPTGNQLRGLGQGYTRVFLPIWLQKSFGDWTTYGGGGYWFNQSERLGDKNYWYAGWLLQRKIYRRTQPFAVLRGTRHPIQRRENQYCIRVCRLPDHLLTAA